MDEQPEIKKRRWWLALLSQLVGAGYIYVGKPIRFAAIMAFTALVILALVHGCFGWAAEPRVYVSATIFAALLTVLVIVDLIRLAVRQKDYQLRWYNSWWVYLACSLVSVCISFVPELMGGFDSFAVRSFSTPSASNSPTIKIGDYFTADTQAYRKADPVRGEMVVFRLPRNETTFWVKRVIGLPGDTIQMKNGAVILNGNLVTQKPEPDVATPFGQAKVFRETLPNGHSYQTLDLAKDSPTDNTDVYTIPTGHFFMLGDNRDNSADSRLADVGFVSRKNIYAKAIGIVYATDLSRIGLKFH